jgi:hypothetical protein
LLAGCGASSHLEAKCPAAALRPSLETEGENEGAVVFVTLANGSGSTCVASGSASFEIDRNGRRVPFDGNPLNVAVKARIPPRQKRLVANAWWGNWCGSRERLDVAVRFGGSVTRSRFAVLPVCLQGKYKPQLVGGTLDLAP